MTRTRNRGLLVGFCSLLALAAALAVVVAAEPTLTPSERLGKSIFFDLNLSINRNQSCAACHAPQVGWTGPDAAINIGGSVYEGSIPGRFGDRKPPASSYATFAPILYLNKAGLFIGGNFWDGRATGERLGNPAADQAQGPFLNPAEQALPDAACVVWRVCEPVVPADYPVSFEDVWGPGTCDISWPDDVGAACANEGTHVLLSPADRSAVVRNYDWIALSIADYEGSPEVNAFTSKFDASLMGLVELSKEERRGFALFQGKGKCKNCHTSAGLKPLFTDYTYDNLGLPKNPANPVYATNPAFIDHGLGGFLATRPDYAAYAAANLGKHKVPTLRNVDKRPSPDLVKAFGHNGYFKSLKSIVHFYNTRDVLPSCPHGDPGEGVTCWPPAEVPQNVNIRELGNLGLTDAEENAIVTFLKTLSDGWTAGP